MSTINHTVLNTILSIAGPSDYHEGMHWYDDAKRFAQETANQFELPLNKVAGVIAVLSPRQSWRRNKDLAHLMCELYHAGAPCPDESQLGCFSANIDKAWNILHADLRETPIFNWVRGPKVTAFYHNIMGDPNAITLDTHALNAWYGDTACPRGGVFRKSEREAAEQCYRDVAAQRGLTPAQCQAVVWVTWRYITMSSAQVAHYG